MAIPENFLGVAIVFLSFFFIDDRKIIFLATEYFLSFECKIVTTDF